MITISLEGIKVKAPVGFYEGERILGRDFKIDIKITVPVEEAALHDDLQNTVNYETLAAIVQEQMQQPVKLIETVAMQIADKIHERFLQVQRVWVKIAKPNPMLNGSVGQSSIEYVWEKPPGLK